MIHSPNLTLQKFLCIKEVIFHSQRNLEFIWKTILPTNQVRVSIYLCVSHSFVLHPLARITAISSSAVAKRKKKILVRCSSLKTCHLSSASTARIFRIGILHFLEYSVGSEQTPHCTHKHSFSRTPSPWYNKNSNWHDVWILQTWARQTQQSFCQK